MTDLAPHLSAFLKQYLPQERNFSRHTVQSYTDCFRLLALDTAQQLAPCEIEHRPHNNSNQCEYPPGGDASCRLSISRPHR